MGSSGSLSSSEQEVSEKKDIAVHTSAYPNFDSFIVAFIKYEFTFYLTAAKDVQPLMKRHILPTISIQK